MITNPARAEAMRSHLPAETRRKPPTTTDTRNRKPPASAHQGVFSFTIFRTEAQRLSEKKVPRASPAPKAPASEYASIGFSR